MKKQLLILVSVVLLLLLGNGHELSAQKTAPWDTILYGGVTEAKGFDVATDVSGNVYLSGSPGSIPSTSFAGFQTTWGTGGCFLVKFDSSGNYLWGNYYGELASCIATDASGNVYLAGGDSIRILDSSGKPLWAISGFPSGGGVSDITIDIFGNVYLAGIINSIYIASGGFQNTFGGGTFDAFLVKFNSSGIRQWDTYYGGSGEEIKTRVATDLFGNVYLSGGSSSTTHIASGGFQNIYGGGQYDAFLVKFDSTGMRRWGTYYGGSGDEYATCIATDAAGNVCIGGETGTGLPVFLVKFDSSGIRQWLTSYYATHCQDIAMDASGNIYLSGASYGGVFPAAVGGFRTSPKGVEDAYLMMFNRNGAQICGTYYLNGHTELAHVAVDGFGHVSLGGWGGANSPRFPSYAYIVQFTICDSTILTSNIVASHINCTDSCTGTAKVLTTGGVPPYTYSWSPDVTGQFSQTATGLCAGNYTVTVTDAVNNTNTVAFTITQFSTYSITVNATQTGCGADTGTATAIPAGGIAPYTWVWNTGANSATATLLAAGAYTVTGADSSGCVQSQTVHITQIPATTIAASASETNMIQGGNTYLNATGSGPYLWSPTDNLSCITCANPTANPSKTTAYCVLTTDSNNCMDSACITIAVHPSCTIFVPTAFSPNNDKINDVLYIKADCVEPLHFKIFDRWGNKVFETEKASKGWDGTYGSAEFTLNPAVFVYYLQGILTDGNPVNQKGNISLIR